MGISVAGLASSVAQQNLRIAAEQPQQHQAGSNSFQSMLQARTQIGQESAVPSTAPVQSQQVAATQQETVRVEMMDPQVRRELTRLILNDERQARGVGGSGSFMDMLSRVEKTSGQSDAILRELAAKKDFSQGELMVMQAVVYKAAQSTEVLSKVVDQVTGSVKTILNTNV